jgi:hypothetical protein
MQRGFPDNFFSLHEGEEFIRSKSIQAIEGSGDLLAHAGIIESSMDLIDYFARQYPNRDADDLTVQLLGIRLFNGSASAMKLLLSGYCQASALLQRDLLETTFLLDYFQTDRGLISAWRTSDKRKRQRLFKPVAVRKALDDRDGYTGGKRGKAYSDLSELAGHASYAGFRMLTATPGGDAHCGPFFELTTMKATLEELANQLAQAGVAFTRFFPTQCQKDLETSILWIEAFGPWAEKFHGRPFDRAPVDDLRALLDQAAPQRPDPTI